VRLLLDENLSPGLVQRLAAAGIPAFHVAHCGLAGATDRVCRPRARTAEQYEEELAGTARPPVLSSPRKTEREGAYEPLPRVGRGRTPHSWEPGSRNRSLPGSAVMMAPTRSSVPWAWMTRSVTSACCSAERPTRRRMPAWGDLPDDGEFSEVLVESDEDSGLGESASQDLLFARVGRPIARPDDVVPGRPEPFDGAAPDAGVEEESHVPAGTRNGSTRSWATSRLA
jgi:hypothetical protein